MKNQAILFVVCLTVAALARAVHAGKDVYDAVRRSGHTARTTKRGRRSTAAIVVVSMGRLDLMGCK